MTGEEIRLPPNPTAKYLREQRLFVCSVVDSFTLQPYYTDQLRRFYPSVSIDRLLAYLRRQGGELALRRLGGFDSKVSSAEREKLMAALQAEGKVDVYPLERESGRPRRHGEGVHMTQRIAVPVTCYNGYAAKAHHRFDAAVFEVRHEGVPLRDAVVRYNAEGMAALRDRPRRGPTPRLDEERRATLRRLVLDVPDVEATG